MAGALRARALPSQEGQQGPWRGWAQGAGGHGRRWQDTEPSRQRQRWQGSPGRKKCSWWRTGSKPPGLGQLEGEAEARRRASWGARGEAAELPTPGEARPGCCSHLGTAGSTLGAAGPAPHRAAAGSGGPGTARCRSAWTEAPRRRVSAGGRGDLHPSPPPRRVDCSWQPPAPPLLPCLLPSRADSPDSDTGGRGQRGGGSLLRGGTLSHRRHSLGEGAARGLGEALLAPGHALPAPNAHRRGQPPQETPLPVRLTMAVTAAAGTRQRVGTGGLGAGPRLAAGVAFLTPALLAGVPGVGEALAVRKHLFLQDTVWAGGGEEWGRRLKVPGAGRQLLSPWSPELWWKLSPQRERRGL